MTPGLRSLQQPKRTRLEGNFHEDPDKWVMTKAIAVHYNQPVHLKADGRYVVLPSYEDIQDQEIHDRDALLFDHHGEVVSFVAKATQQGILDPDNPQNNTGILVDAHSDAAENGMVYAGRKDYPGRRIYAEQTREIVKRYLAATNESEQRALFQELIAYTQGDCITFIHGIRDQVGKVCAAIRAEQTLMINYLNHIPVMQTAAYRGFLTDGEQTMEPLTGLISEIKGNALWLIDGDFTGTAQEEANKEIDPAQRRTWTLNQRMSENYLVDGLQSDLERKDGNRLYTLSYDTIFCPDPIRTIDLFMERFYKKLQGALAA